MALPLQHVRHQGRVVAALGRGALTMLEQRMRGAAGADPVTPGPLLTETVPPRDPAMVRDYVRWAGGDPGAYKGRVPPHLFPQWTFPLQGRTLEGLPYPLARVLNGGCNLEIKGDVPLGRPLEVSGRLESIDDDGRRAVLRQRVTTKVDGVEVLAVEFFPVVPLKREKGKKKKAPALVPRDAREIGWWRLPADAGLAFACLTGDFNPVHWVPAYARAAGFRNTILHGFATMARAIESLNRVRFAGDTRRLARIDVRFTKPLVLPARVGCYVRDDALFVGDAPGAPAYLTASFRTRDSEETP